MTCEPTVGKELHRLDLLVRRALMQGAPPPLKGEATGNHGRIIHFLLTHEERPVYQKDLEAEFGIARSTASRVLRLMEENGLIERRSVSGDARMKQVVLTGKARACDQAIRLCAQAMEARLLTGFSPEEKRTLLSFLARMEANLSEKTRDSIFTTGGTE